MCGTDVSSGILTRTDVTNPYAIFLTETPARLVSGEKI